MSVAQAHHSALQLVWMHMSHVMLMVDGMGQTPPSPPPSLGLPDELPLLLPDELPLLLPDELPLLLPDELPLLLPDELVPPSPPPPEVDVTEHAGCPNASANPPTTTTTADQANLFIVLLPISL
jgi:hypothetical protein